MRPNLLIIGAHKCGTSALHQFLALHPEVFMSRTKELHFFVEEVSWHRGLDWYESYFRAAAQQPRVRVIGESSPSYTNFPKYSGVAERAYGLVPDAKLILMVRDPVDRIVSHYRMERARSKAPRPIEQTALRHFRNPYVWQSMYWMQLRQYLDYFPMSRVLIETQEELLTAPRKTLRRVFEFLGVDPSFDHRDFDQLINTSDDREQRSFGNIADAPAITDRHRTALVDHLAPDIDQFRRHTGRSFSTWCL